MSKSKYLEFSRFPSALRGRWEIRLRGFAGARHRLENTPTAVALTFDDGPDPRYTPRVLAALEQAGVQATFFQMGERVQSHPELAKQVRDAGHCVGSHSFSHSAPAGRSVSEIKSDYRRGQQALKDATGETSVLFRPPYGAITTSSMLAMRQLRLAPWLWSKDPGDWRSGASARGLLGSLSQVRAGDVVLLHDGAGDEGEGIDADRSATIELIEPLVELVKARGLSFVTLDGRSKH